MYLGFNEIYSEVYGYFVRARRLGIAYTANYAISVQTFTDSLTHALLEQVLVIAGP